MAPMAPRKKHKRRSTASFDVQRFLDSAGAPQRVMRYERSATVFSQGDAATSVMYIQHGGIKLSVLSPSGKEAVVALLGPGEFFGEGCLAGQRIRMATATALTSTAVLVLDKRKTIEMLHQQSTFSDRFIAHMLAR